MSGGIFMKCEQCGTNNLEGSSFCKKCGKKFKEEFNTTNSLDMNVNEDRKNKDNSRQVEKDNQNSRAETNSENNTNNSFAVYCQCGQRLEPNWKFCPKCKSPITVEIKGEIDTKGDKNIKDGNAYLYIAIYVISIACGYFLKFNWSFLIAIITIITGEIKYPDNKAIKILFGLTIIHTVLFILFIGWFLIACVYSINSCPG